ncbi:MAG: hypothetical protein V2J25_03130 [Desulfatiglans sp.]|jgi:cadmium resistance protein CadD (predicted permease)|nr:hypothetical protein [Thermodesulfobacteriota bacterium]MEE4351838.1 hypothetical protein [Desulfatiglans sp.]
MKTIQTFIIRLVLSVLFAFLVAYFFFNNPPLIKVLGLAAIFLGLSYLLMYARQSNNEDG